MVLVHLSSMLSFDLLYIYQNPNIPFQFFSLCGSTFSFLLVLQTDSFRAVKGLPNEEVNFCQRKNPPKKKKHFGKYISIWKMAKALYAALHPSKKNKKYLKHKTTTKIKQYFQNGKQEMKRPIVQIITDQIITLPCQEHLRNITTKEQR